MRLRGKQKFGPGISSRRRAFVVLIVLVIGWASAGCGGDDLGRPDPFSTVIPGQQDGWYVAIPDYPVPIGYQADVWVHSPRDTCCDLVTTLVVGPDGAAIVEGNRQVGGPGTEWTRVYSSKPEQKGTYTVEVRRVAGGELRAKGEFRDSAGIEAADPTPRRFLLVEWPLSGFPSSGQS
jgi:hypothetical protein